jgi:hypothetical protein
MRRERGVKAGIELARDDNRTNVAKLRKLPFESLQIWNHAHVQRAETRRRANARQESREGGVADENHEWSVSLRPRG